MERSYMSPFWRLEFLGGLLDFFEKVCSFEQWDKLLDTEGFGDV
jgi:hypothetical protein